MRWNWKWKLILACSCPYVFKADFLLESNWQTASGRSGTGRRTGRQLQPGVPSPGLLSDDGNLPLSSAKQPWLFPKWVHVQLTPVNMPKASTSHNIWWFCWRFWRRIFPLLRRRLLCHNAKQEWMNFNKKNSKTKDSWSSFMLKTSWNPKAYNNWRARCKNGLSDDFGPPFTKPRNYLTSCNVKVAKGLMLCSQHIILAIRMEFLPKEHQFSLLLTRKEKIPKCQEIPIISAVDYLNRKWCSGSFFHSKMADFVLPLTLSSATFTDSYSVTPGLCLQVPKPKPTNQNAHQKVLTQQLKQENERLPPYFDH